MKSKQSYPLRSWILVIIQMVCLIYIGTTGPWKAHRIDFQIWQLSGLFVALAGLIGLNWHSFSIFPEPKTKGRLVRSGIFGFIRHPMYAGLLIIAGALVWEFWSWQRFGAAVILAVVLIIKITIEEQKLSEKFEDYEDYQKNTNRLIPFIW